jgi:hypothetical protein
MRTATHIAHIWPLEVSFRRVLRLFEYYIVSTSLTVVTRSQTSSTFANVAGVISSISLCRPILFPPLLDHLACE